MAEGYYSMGSALATQVHKCEDLGSDPQNPHKHWMVIVIPIRDAWCDDFKEHGSQSEWHY